MSNPQTGGTLRRYRTSLLLVVLLATAALPTLPTSAVETGYAATRRQPATGDNISPTFTAYLPTVPANYPWSSPLGVQVDPSHASRPPALERSRTLNIGWVRVGAISWSDLQPVENGPIRWDLLQGLDQTLVALRQAGIRAHIAVIGSPRWATVNQPFPTSCGAIRRDKFGAFAQFMQTLATRYGQPPFEMHDWELGNEIDIDPTLVNIDSGIGCWGDKRDPFYGGREYGEMLKVVTPAIRQANPQARVWIGGLLLDSPNTNPANGRPEFFLKGILEAGAAPYFDILPFHIYTAYVNQVRDSDLIETSKWHSLGGVSLGKARFLRSIMREYGVDKPLFVNELAILCPEYFPFNRWCLPPGADFYQNQASSLVRMVARLLAEDIQGVVWYQLESPAWRYSSLLDESFNPTPAYFALQHLGAALQYARYLRSVDFGSGIEGYTFSRDGQEVDIIWARQDTPLPVALPSTELRLALDREGRMLTPTPQGANQVLLVGFDPIYLIRDPSPAP